MKISNASKKVLASALSAAMVVAFAPTVAFAGNGTKIAVSLDSNGGIYADGSVTSFPNAEQTDKISLPAVTKGGYAGTWYYDTNNDGKIDTSDTAWTNGTSALPSDKTEVAFKAIFANAPVAATTFNGTKTITATIDAGNAGKLVENKKYTLKVTSPSGKVIIEKKGVEKGSAEISATAVFDADNIDSEFLVGGTYTTTITDEDGNVVYTSGASDSLGITQLNVKDTADTKNDTTLYITAGDATTTVLNGATYVDAEGYSLTSAGAAALKAGVYDIKKVTASKTVGITPVAYNASARTIGFTPSYTNVPTNGTVETAVVDPNNKTIWSATDSSATGMSATFKQGTSAASFAGATETAGDYVYTATVKDADGEVVATGKAKVTLTQVVYAVSEGVEFQDAYTKADAQSFWTSDTTFADSGSNKNYKGITTVTKAKEGYTLATKWQLDGKDLSASNAIVAGKVNTLTATAKVTDVSMNVVDPVVDSSSYDATKKEWTVKVSTATAGAQIKWGTSKDDINNAYDASKGIVTKAETIYVKAFKATGSTASSITEDSNPVEMTCLTNDWSDFASTTGAVYKKVGKSTSTYADAPEVKAALEAGDAAVKEAGYKTAKDMKTLIDGNAKAVYTAVKAYAEAQLAAYANGALVVVGDKAYTIDAKTLAAAQKDIAASLKDVKDTDSAAQYKGYIKTIVTKTNDTLNAAVESAVKAADIAAAKTVNDAIAALPAEITAANATEVKAAAEKVLADYAALGADAQKLVSSADYAKAVAAVDAADAAIADADKAAVAKVKGKTVKAKASKKTTAKLTKVTSESGTVSTFKKTSGNAKITVSKSGKITVKKGLKKGKKYTAKVKATIGASTKTVKVVVKVAK